MMEIKDTATSGADIIQIESHLKVPPNSEIKVDLPLGELYKKDLEFQAMRGQIINSSLWVEEKIELLIAKLLIPSGGEASGLFISCVLGREFFTFMAKWKVLRDLLKAVSPLNEKDHSKMLTDIKEIIDVRDMFAHGKNLYLGDGKENKLVIEYFKDGLKREEVTSSFLEEHNRKAKELYMRLDELTRVIDRISVH